jgi:NADH dehydrogenase
VTQPRVVVVGAGFGGLAAAKVLARLPVVATVVDRRNYHTFQPLLYQVATAGLDASSIAYPVRGVVARGRHRVGFRLGEVDSVDWDARQVLLSDGGALAYDYLILAAGAVTSDFGIPGAAAHAFGLKSVTDATRLRAHLLAQFEAADAGTASALRNAGPARAGTTSAVPGAGTADGGAGDSAARTIVVVGGGPTGVELCGGLSELVFDTLQHDLELPAGAARIVLVEMGERVLAPFHPKSSVDALRQLERRGVEVRLNAAVASVAADRITLRSGEAIPANTVVWAAGVRPCPLAERLGLERDRGGRVVVGEDLSVAGRPEVFVIGDLAAATPPGQDRPYPQLAPVAMQQGRHAALQIRARLAGRPGTPFHYRDKGTMATIGRNAAVAELPGGIRFRGFPAWVAWLGLHLVFLIGFRNRLTVLLDWSWNYVTHQRGVRLIIPVLSDDETTGTEVPGEVSGGTPRSTPAG